MSGRSGAEITSNLILRHLSADDRGLLAPHLVQVDLPARKSLEAPNRRIEYIFFIESGFASVVVNGTADRDTEVGLIGREGVTGFAVVMATDRSPNAVYMQYAGKGQRITTVALKKAMRQSETLQIALLNYCHAFHIQATQTALANGRGKIEQRLARWLCMAQDRIESAELALTHEFISIMLGVRRPGVTLMLESLERAALIQRKRGVISIIDREGLEKITDGAYGVPEAEFRRLFG